MKPIERGMTEAVTRDGRKVTQLTWFDINGKKGPSVAGVVDSSLECWNIEGKYFGSTITSPSDIFAPPEYEWQWLYQCKNGTFDTTGYCKTEQEMLDRYNGAGSHNFTRIEESKREVKS